MRIDRVSINRLLSISGVLVLLAMPAAAQQGIQISRATYGCNQRSKLRCHPAIAAAVQRQGRLPGLCRSQVSVPGSRLWTAKVGCRGLWLQRRMDTKSFPDGAQLFLQCSNSAETPDRQPNRVIPAPGIPARAIPACGILMAIGLLPWANSFHCGRWTVSSGNSVGS